MGRKDKDPVELEVVFQHETDRAVLVEHEGRELWLPKSVVHFDQEWFEVDPDDQIDIKVEEWFATKEGLN